MFVLLELGSKCFLKKSETLFLQLSSVVFMLEIFSKCSVITMPAASYLYSKLNALVLMVTYKSQKKIRRVGKK